MIQVFCTIDDKRIPLYRILWISDLPHFCGNGECEREGQYEVRLEHNETIWANLQDTMRPSKPWGTWLKHRAREERSPGVTPMLTFEDGRFRSRETYFVLFPEAKRPTLKAVQKALAAINKNYLLSHPGADAQGHFESITLISPEDYAALDICFTSGQEVTEQIEALARTSRRASSRGSWRP